MIRPFSPSSQIDNDSPTQARSSSMKIRHNCNSWCTSAQDDWLNLAAIWSELCHPHWIIIICRWAYVGTGVFNVQPPSQAPLPSQPSKNACKGVHCTEVINDLTKWCIHHWRQANSGDLAIISIFAEPKPVRLFLWLIARESLDRIRGEMALIQLHNCDHSRTQTLLYDSMCVCVYFQLN